MVTIDVRERGRKVVVVGGKRRQFQLQELK
jgi:hypothetical protein